jgi:hypothetical protein
MRECSLGKKAMNVGSGMIKTTLLLLHSNAKQRHTKDTNPPTQPSQSTNNILLLELGIHALKVLQETLECEDA